ncbi:hypothetical protein NEUTE2DRAFT_131368 [Neurospora tetrasperma FGSC 2509]|nr:hypothetical protein NEUTE2DRAFT_131368 [Neurospora tetrasperma FGSC 2509]
MSGLGKRNRVSVVGGSTWRTPRAGIGIRGCFAYSAKKACYLLQGIFHSDTGLEGTRIVTITRELCGLVSK